MSKYDFGLEITPGFIPEKIMSRIRPGSRVLEFGCAEGRMTKYMTKELRCRVCVVELDSDACKVAANWAEKHFCGDLEEDQWVSFYEGELFDYLLFADVLEHLRNPEHVLSKAKALLKDEGEVLITIPNIAHHDVVANLINDNFTYTDIGLLDNTHVHFWGKRDLEGFAARCGFSLKVLDGVDVGVYCTEQASEVRLSPMLDELLNHRPNNTVYQYFFVLTKSCNQGTLEDRLVKPRQDQKAAFYWDFGEGYSQEQLAFSSPVIQDNGDSLFSEMLIPPHCKKVRFDPIEGTCCFVSNLQCTVDGVEKAVQNTNGIRMPSGILFLTEDPQIEFALLDCACSISICANIRRFSEIEARDLREVIEKNENVKNDLQQQCNTLKQNYKNLEDMFHSLAIEARDLRKAVKVNENVKNDLQQQYDMLQQNYKNLEDTFHSLENGYWSLENAYNMIICSWSYRMTVPIRRLLNVFKSTRIGKNIFLGLGCLKNTGLKGTAKKFVSLANSRLVTLEGHFRIMRMLLNKTWKSLRTDGVRITLAKISLYKKKQKMCQMAAAKKLYTISEIGNFLGVCIENGGEIFGKENIVSEDKDRVLLVSHELNLTGAPVALEYFAVALQRMRKRPIMLAPHDDVLRKRICDAGIPVVILPTVYNSNIVPSAAHLFEFIVVSTNVGAPLVGRMNGMSIPVLWWIHEARASYFPEAIAAMPEFLEPNIHVYCGGVYAQRVLREYRPNYISQQLLYYVEDSEKQDRHGIYNQLKDVEGKTIFAIIGMLEYRKGQDIFVEAIRMLPYECLRECFFVFIGRECYPPIMESIRGLLHDYPENVLYIPQCEKEDLQDVYSRMDCLVCASRDDPMPIVVADAMSNYKVVICSENTGYCQMFEEMGGGLLYRQDDSKKLMECLMYVQEHKGNMKSLQQLARATYERYFSREQFLSNVSDVIYNLKVRDHSINDFCNLFSYKCYGGVQQIYLEDQLCDFDREGKRSILLFSHELSLTGATVVLKDLAHVLRSQGNNVAVLSPFDGPMREEFVKDSFPVILFENVYVPENQKEFLQFAKCFQLIICNTIVTFRTIPYLGTINVPVVWWIHDSRESYNEGGFGSILPKEVPSNVRILCGGDYAKKQLLTYYPQYSAEVLLYGVKDKSQQYVEESKRISVKEEKKILFVCIGTLERRKGQDILVEAILLLPEKVRRACKFLFIGKKLQENIWEKLSDTIKKFPDTISYIPQVSRDELQWIYRDADCLICCSRDDPMPVVVTEMQSFSKIVICSENTGSASLIQKTHGGVVYENNSPDVLAEKIRYVLTLDEAAVDSIRTNARMTYLQYFSQQKYEENVSGLVERMCSEDERIMHTRVSVVIPCFNAGEQGKKLIQKLSVQRGIESLEIVCVDSGSSDGTQDFCRNNGCKVIQISQNEFSHSYARNLGVTHASGSVIIVMSQDAMPDSEDWITRMIRPIVLGQAAAVSCRECSPENTDLYYRVASWTNAHWLGILREDRVGRYHPDMSTEELRINASLNDVACAFEKNVFIRFGYRFGYAEDLDLGIRLLKSGFKVKLLHDPTVIHGHSRNAWYYLKRGLVEAQALRKILNTQQVSCSVKEIVNRLIPGYIAVHNTLAILSDSKFESSVEFTKGFQTVLKAQMEEKLSQMMEGWAEEKEIEEFLHSLTSGMDHVCMDDMMIANSMSHYVEFTLHACLKENQWMLADWSHDMCECIYKQMALMVGTTVAAIDPNEEIYDAIQEYVKGV